MPNLFTKGERRRWRRHWLKAPVRIISPAGVVDGYGLRVSDGGMYLFAVADFEIGGHIELEFKKPHSSEPRRCSGVVRNRVVYLYGVEFLQAQPSLRTRRPEAIVNS